jgi:hypothetical protein
MGARVRDRRSEDSEGEKKRGNGIRELHFEQREGSGIAEFRLNGA